MENLLLQTTCDTLCLKENKKIATILGPHTETISRELGRIKEEQGKKRAIFIHVIACYLHRYI